jgi:hypothetical protein
MTQPYEASAPHPPAAVHHAAERGVGGMGLVVLDAFGAQGGQWRDA